MELLAVGAVPRVLAASLAVEPEPTGRLVLAGIRRELKVTGLSSVRILSSTEKNVNVNQTGIGVTAVGFVSRSALKIGLCQEGDEVVTLGEPLVGQEVIPGEKSRRIADTLDVIRLGRKPYVHELIPVGSKGILYEASTLAKDSNLVFKPDMSPRIDLNKSAGPATTLLCAVPDGGFEKMKRAFEGAKTIRKIGTLRRA